MTDWTAKFGQIADEIVAIAIVIGGLILCAKQRFDEGWKMIVFGAGYLFGKNAPRRGGTE